MVRYRPIALTVAALVFASAAWHALPAVALDAAEMKAALHTSAPEEDGFIDRTLDLVDDGTLPEKMVVSTFLWARRKSQHKFQYFKRALILRAARKGIRL